MNSQSKMAWNLKTLAIVNFCGAETSVGVHECLEIFNLGFQHIDFSDPRNHMYRFLIVDAHTLQHPEIHGRWNNHFHLTRLQLIIKYNIKWQYHLSPQLSDHLNAYKKNNADEYLEPPPILQRGNVTTTDVLNYSNNETECKAIIEKWAIEVHRAWEKSHPIVDGIAQGFLNR